ncbi:FecR domain-containing protein [Niabella pedocola]|uniref:FecR domain-containing protein n=1 Tax=Niabella pedocola TaxID=1752077 RepID=A0ABS8PY35_9BACT|nr:FecR family protein [Niabella pedocola]MCD2425960.1 FecR domain-containing protein [Niabella pedocola]
MNAEIEQLYQRFLGGKCSREEAELLLSYFETSEGDTVLQELISGHFDQPVMAADADPGAAFDPDKIHRRLLQQLRRPRLVRLRRIAVAASVLLVVFSGFFLMRAYRHQNNPPLVARQAGIAPGGNRATLVLSTGKSLALSEKQTGIRVDTGGVQYEDGEALAPRGSASFATLQTPRGGQYRIVLPDGTKVWLNAESALIYPMQFNEKERHVELKGEAYFEVAKNAGWPFVVKLQTGDVTVKGTRFNVQAYAQDPGAKITLAEGAVEVASTTEKRLLRPNQEASLQQGAAIKVRSVNAEQALAWVDGYFLFDNMNLRQMLQHISRWYDVDVRIQAHLSDQAFWVRYTRSKGLQELLDYLKEFEHFNYSIRGRTLLITD